MNASTPSEADSSSGAVTPELENETDEAFTIAKAALATAVEAQPDRKRGKKAKFESETEELSRPALRRRDMRQTIFLRRTMAWFAIIAVTIQLVCADLLFWSYLSKAGAKADPSVMIAWLSATVVEVIGIVVIIARNLFPSKGKTRDERSALKNILTRASRRRRRSLSLPIQGSRRDCLERVLQGWPLRPRPTFASHLAKVIFRDAAAGAEWKRRLRSRRHNFATEVRRVPEERSQPIPSTCESQGLEV